MKSKIKNMSLIAIALILFSASFFGCNNNIKSEREVLGDTLIKEQEKEQEQDINKDNVNNKDVEQSQEENEEDIFPAIHYGDVQIDSEIVFSEDFETDEAVFGARGSATGKLVSDQSYSGSQSLLTTNRIDHWNGPILNVTDALNAGETYNIKANIMYNEGPEQIEIDCMIEKDGSQYYNVGSTMAKKGVWIELEGRIILPKDMTSVGIYFENKYDAAEEEIVDFYIDEVVITKESIYIVQGKIPSIKDVYEDYFTIGFAATVSETTLDSQKLMKEQFNSFTTGNELKPDSLLDYDKCTSDPKYDDNPQITLKNAKYLLEFAKEAGMPMRGHTLVWHSQTPRWFFSKDYSMAKDAPLVSKELMLKRMENYIKNVLGYIQTNYPGLIYAWDVVNEAVEVADGQPGSYRSKESYWYQIIGEEFLEKAFEYARKYANPEVKLFYNDYNTEQASKMNAIIDIAKMLKSKGLIDGIGLQSHIGDRSPSITDIESSIRKYAELELEIQITELDMFMTDNSQEALMKQASRYKRLFLTLKNLKDKGIANITNITFWGVSDDTSWLNKPGVPNYPLLFDQYLLQKPAFWGAIMHKDIPFN